MSNVEAPALVMDDDQRENYEASLSHQIPRKPFDKHIDETIYLEIEERLRAREQFPGYSTTPSFKWSKNARLYTLLRMLEYRDGDPVFKKFEHEEIGDFWLPLTDPLLKQLASVPGFSPADFRNGQRHVMSDSKQMDEKNLLVPFFERRYIPHRYVEFTKSHFTDSGEIGSGGSARVLCVKHKLSGKEFACKRLFRTRTIMGQRHQMKQFEQEVKVLQGLRHHHIVHLVASFTDLESFSIILDPIADHTLLEMLKHAQPLSDIDIAILCCSFNCLATALAFLHGKSIRHKDIKPSNILVSEGRVLLCDFGISLEWTESDNGTTESVHPSFTRRYAAPEVFQTSRNSKTDIWSLGCVFLEVVSAIKGFSFNDIDVGECRDGQRLSATAMKSWLKVIKNEPADVTYDLPIDWILAMIMDDPRERPEAGDIVSKIHEDTTAYGLTQVFLASCCRRFGYDSPFRNSINSAQTSTRSSDSRTHESFAYPLWNGSSPRSYRYQSSASPPSEDVPPPARNFSTGPTSIRPPTPRVRQIRANLMEAPNTAVFSSPRASTVTPRMSQQSESACFDISEPFSLQVRESPDLATNNDLRATSVVRGFSRFCALRDREEHLFQEAFVTFTLEESATIEKFSQCCDNSRNTVQVFETPCARIDGHRSLAPPIWKVTRRVVLSNATSPNAQECYNFWLPLTDIRFSLCEAKVTLQWSDCNQLQQGRNHDQREHWSWVYDPVRPNNELNIEFCGPDSAKSFLDILRFPLNNGSMLNISDSQEIRTWNRTISGKKESIVSLTNHEEPLSDSKLFVVGQYVDLRIEKSSHNCQLDVRLNNISKPYYVSDLVEEPIRYRNRVAQFREAQLLAASLEVLVPLGSDHESPVPPPSITTMFHGLTGWTLQYFAAVEQVKSEKHAISKRRRYGTADVMLWRKEVQNSVSARITFRLTENSNVWMSGRISASSSVLSSSKDAACWFDMFGKQHGNLLDISSMSAVSELALSDPSSVDPAWSFQNESRRVTLHIKNHKHRQKFAELVEELTRAVANNPPASNANRTPVTQPRHVPATPLA